MTGNVFGGVLSLPEGHVGWLHEDAGTIGPRPFAVGLRILDSHDDRVRHLAWTRRPTVTVDVTDNDRAITEAELRPVVLADPDSLDKAERGS